MSNSSLFRVIGRGNGVELPRDWDREIRIEGNFSGTLEAVPKKRTVMLGDQPIGVVGTRYQPIQPRKIMDACRDTFGETCWYYSEKRQTIYTSLSYPSQIDGCKLSRIIVLPLLVGAVGITHSLTRIFCENQFTAKNFRASWRHDASGSADCVDFFLRLSSTTNPARVLEFDYHRVMSATESMSRGEIEAFADQFFPHVSERRRAALVAGAESGYSSTPFDVLQFFSGYDQHHGSPLRIGDAHFLRSVDRAARSGRMLTYMATLA